MLRPCIKGACPTIIYSLQVIRTFHSVNSCSKRHYCLGSNFIAHISFCRAWYLPAVKIYGTVSVTIRWRKWCSNITILANVRFPCWFGGLNALVTSDQDMDRMLWEEEKSCSRGKGDLVRMRYLSLPISRYCAFLITLVELRWNNEYTRKTRYAPKAVTTVSQRRLSKFTALQNRMPSRWAASMRKGLTMLRVFGVYRALVQ